MTGEGAELDAPVEQQGSKCYNLFIAVKFATSMGMSKTVYVPITVSDDGLSLGTIEGRVEPDGASVDEMTGAVVTGGNTGAGVCGSATGAVTGATEGMIGAAGGVAGIASSKGAGLCTKHGARE
jgi:hypothetical protein